MRDTADKLLRYLLTGGVAAIVDAGGFALLSHTPIGVVPAAVTSFLIAAIVNYRLSSRFVFRQPRSGRSFALFLSGAVFGLIVNVSVTLAAITLLALAPLYAKIVGIGAAFAVNFIVNLRVVFRPPAG